MPGRCCNFTGWMIQYLWVWVLYHSWFIVSVQSRSCWRRGGFIFQAFQVFPQFWQTATVRLNILVAVTVFPLILSLLFLLNKREIPIVQKANVICPTHLSIVHHHPISSHQRIPCPFLPLWECKPPPTLAVCSLWNEMLSLPHFGQVSCFINNPSFLFCLFIKTPTGHLNIQIL